MASPMTRHAVPVLATSRLQLQAKPVAAMIDRGTLATVVAGSAQAWPREVGRTDLLAATFLCQPCLRG